MRSLRHLLVPTLLIACLAGCGSTISLIPTPNIWANQKVEDFDAIPERLRSTDVEILYVTDRTREWDEDNQLWGYGLARSDAMSFGSARVKLGEYKNWRDLLEDSLQVDRQLDASVELTRVLELARWPKLRYVDPRPTEFADERLRQEIRRRLATAYKKHVIVYLHGYNNGYEDAVTSLGALWHFLGREGLPIAFTWPAGAGAGAGGYIHDRESGEFAVTHLKQFLRVLTSMPEVEEINYLAHSRGTDVIASALRELIIEHTAAGRDAKKELKGRRLILFSPDIDTDVARMRVGNEGVVHCMENVTLYMSQADKALGFFSWLTGVSRLGQMLRQKFSERQLDRAAARVPGLDVIDVESAATFLGHSEYLWNPAVSSDLILMLRNNFEPGKGRPLIHAGGNWWRLPVDYPHAKPGRLR